MKKFSVFIILILSIIFLFPNICKAALDVVPGVTPGGVSGVKDFAKNGGYHYTTDVGVRMTVYSESGRRVSNSVDIVFSQKVYNRIIGYVSKDGYPLTTTKNKYIGKVDYIKNNHVVSKWDRTNLKNVILVTANHSSQRADSSSSGIPQYLLSQNVEYLYNLKEDNIPSNINSALKLCSAGGYSCKSVERYFAVFEPTMYVWAMGYPMYGTAYELANAIMPNDGVSLYSCNNNCKAKNLDTHLNQALPLTLRISGVAENKVFYKNIGITQFCSSGNTCFGRSKMYRSDILNKGIAMAVYDWTKKVSNLVEDITCPTDVNINECGVSSINEATSNACVSDNKVFSYLDSCNLYCSDTITTDFSGLYNTFIGNNKLNAIKSGKYQSIKGNPKITITKTCYQSKSSNECPNVTQSFKSKLSQDYKTNNIILNVDGNSYTLIGSPTISNNGYSSATITYEYRLNDNVNKYINIETMKGADLTEQNKNKVIINGKPMIITSKASYGVYNYNLDVSATALNKYISSGTVLRNFKNVINSKYNIQNKLTIKYKDEEGKEKTSYTNNDLNYSCSYVKYNTDDGCICPENTVCDSITCEPLNESPCNCTSQYGCLDDGRCTPIAAPTPDSEVCNPEVEVCMPNVIYRPISLKDPFPGIDGGGRIPGSNWNRLLRDRYGKLIYYNGSVVGVSDYYIRYNRGYNDYEIYQTKPLYTIKLDADTINYIRDYNDAVRQDPNSSDYNDFDFVCEKGEKCISNFLRGNSKIDGYNRNLLVPDRSECYRSNSFDTCITRKN